MKTIILTTMILFATSNFSFSQLLLDKTNNTNKKKDIQKKYNEEIKNINKTIKDSSNQKYIYNFQMENEKKEIEKKKEDESGSKSSIDLIGKLVSGIRNVSPNPEISLNGVYDPNDFFRCGIRLLIAQKVTEAEKSEGVSNIFINEKSLYSFNLIGLFVPKFTILGEYLGINGLINYSGKNISSISSDSSIEQNEDFGTLNAKIGVEIAVVKNKVSIYSNFNYSKVVTNVRNFNSMMNNTSSGEWNYWEAGFKGFFDINSNNSNNQNLFAEIKFVFANRNMKTIADTEDILFQVLSVGYSGSILK